MNNNYFLHMGWSKTATTSIQHVLSEINGIQYLGRPFSEEMFQLMAYFTYANDIFFDDDRFQKRLKELIQGDKSQTVVISDEHLTPICVSNPIRFSRIKNNFPDVKIILTIRNQISVLKSVYVHKFLKKKCFSRPHFLDWLERGVCNNWEYNFYTNYNAIELGAYINPVAYDYILTVNELEKIFGRQNIKILLFENFVNDYRGFVGDLYDFIGIKQGDMLGEEAPWLNARQAKKMKIIPHSWFRAVRSSRLFQESNIARGVGSKVLEAMELIERKKGGRKVRKIDFSIPCELKVKIIDYYKPGNKILDKNYNLDLLSKGYLG